MGETRVDLLHLLEDLADAYPGELEETVLTEIVANALDSGARSITCATDAESATLTVVDDGLGMRRADLRRFHDLAASSKERGSGIGFAGVGIKLGLLASDEVVTETRRHGVSVATSWALTNRRRAAWRWIDAPGFVGEHGTAVRLRLSNALSPLLDAGYVETVLRHHFEPLFDAYFDPVLRAHYPEPVSMTVNDKPLVRGETVAGDAVLVIELRLPRKRTPSAFGYIYRAANALPDDRRGIAVSTFGKVIKRGWDWLGIAAPEGERIGGLVEIPALSAALTLNKADFLRSGPRGVTYLSYRKALQEAVMARLAEWGGAPEPKTRAARRAARPMERDLESILADLSGRFPNLAPLVERRAGGHRRMDVRTSDGSASRGGSDVPDLFTPAPAAPPPTEAPDVIDDLEATESLASSLASPAAAEEQEPRGAAPPAPLAPELASGRRSRRAVRLGLTIQFEARPDDPALARLVESTVWVNTAHPAHERATASRMEGYHLAVSAAMALAEVAVDPARVATFVTEFLARWGDVSDGGSRNGNRRRESRRRRR